ncbi:alpha/beta hydrolase [Paenibacillus larvae]
MSKIIDNFWAAGLFFTIEKIERNYRKMKILVGMIILVVLALAVLTIISLYFYRVAIQRTPKEFLANNPNLKQSDNWQARERMRQQWLEDHPCEEVKITSFDGLTLYGYWFPAFHPTNKVALLAHGYTGQGKEMTAYARIYFDKLGWNVLMPDNRGHGQSEGDYIGFGWHDRLDYVAWLDWILQRMGSDVEIVLHGVSMGGATVLMTSGEKLPDQVKAVVADCPYSSVTDILTYHLKEMYKLPAFPLIPATSLVTRIKAGYFFREASALDQVKKSRLPILFIQGDEDKFVPTSMIYPLYEGCRNDKELFLVPGAGHGECLQKDPEGYLGRVTAFVQKYGN